MSARFDPKSRTRVSLGGLLLICLLVAPAAGQITDYLGLARDPLGASTTKPTSTIVLPGIGGDLEEFTCPTDGDLVSAVPRPLTLSGAVDLAICRNPQLRAARFAIVQRSEALGEARAAYLPNLQLNVSRLRSSTSSPGSDVVSTSNTSYAAFSWRILDFGGRAANEALAAERLAATTSSDDAALQSILNDVVGDYFDAATTQATAEVQREAVDVARRTLDSATRREAAGAAARSDTLQARTALAKVMLSASRADGEFQKALALLVQVMGIPAGTPVKIAEAIRPTDGELETQAQTLAAWLSTAQEHHPAIAAARAQVAVARDQVKAARSEGLPTVDLSVSRYQNAYPGQGLLPTAARIFTVGISVSIPIFDGFSRGYKIRGAQAQVDESIAQLQQTEDEILRDVVRSHADAVSALQDFKDSQALIESALESSAASEHRYERGAADILELLNAQAMLADARLERARCFAEWRSSRLRLLAAVGVLNRREVATGR